MNELDVSNEVLCELVDQITNQLQAGESIDLDIISHDYPHYIEQLRQVLPSLELFADLRVATKKPILVETARDESDAVSKQLGDYEIIREVGRGGMGVVYEATHRSLGRRAALKVLPFAAMLDPRQIQRFKNEAQAVAQLDHPNIVDVFGVGCDRGVHFYAMRFIDGRPLSELITGLRKSSLADDARAAETSRNQESDTSRLQDSDPTEPTGPNASTKIGHTDTSEASIWESLSKNRSTKSREFFRSAADLIRQAAAALHHAHQHDVIHRDVKPSNLIVESSGKLWVTDFGLAHVEGNATLTATGDVVGTLRYMSPEQTQGLPVDHRADIYSLGATLYELLTLRPAFPQRDRKELFQKIATEDPPPPRYLNRSIPTDLETIVLKSLEKDPAQRYLSTESFARDLQCFIEDRPITARRPTLFDRTIKWSRRHRSFVGAVVAVVLLALIGLTISTVLMTRSANVAKMERKEAESQRNRAMANERLALQALDEMFIDVFERRFPVEPLTPSDHALLEKALQLYQGLARQNEGYATSRHEVAKAYRRVGDIQTKLARYVQAEEGYRRSIQFFEDLARDFPADPEFPSGIASSTNSLAHSLQSQQKHADAEIAYRRALTIESDLVQRFADRPVYREELARSHNNLGVLFADTGRDADAEQAFVLARDQWSALSRQESERPEYCHHLASSYVNLANLWLKADRNADALSALETSLDISRALAEISAIAENKEQIARALNTIGVLREKNHALEQSEAAYREAVPIWQQLASTYINVPEYQEELVRSCENLARLLRERPESADWLWRTRDSLRRLTEQFPENRRYREQLAETCDRLGEWYRTHGSFQEAGISLVEASQQWESLVERFSEAGSYRQPLSKTYNALGIVYSTSGRPVEARAAYQDALRVLNNMKGDEAAAPGHREAIAKISHNLGLLVGSSDLEAAERFLSSGLASFAGLCREFPTNPTFQHALASSHMALGNLMIATRSPERATEQFRRALVLRERLAKQFSSVAPLQNSLAWLLAGCADPSIRDPARALEHARMAVRLSPKDALFLNTLGVAQYRSGQLQDAIKTLNDAQSMESAGESSDLFYLAMCHQQVGHDEIARAYYEQACQWMERNRPDDIELNQLRNEAAMVLNTAQHIENQPSGTDSSEGRLSPTAPPVGGAMIADRSANM